MIPWPASLSFTFDTEGFQYQPVSNSISIPTEGGEPLTRRRFTGDMDEISGNMTFLTRAQAEAVRSFYRNTLKDGALRFMADDPVTQEGREFIFMGPPVLTPLGGLMWRVQLRLWAL